LNQPTHKTKGQNRYLPLCFVKNTVVKFSFPTFTAIRISTQQLHFRYYSILKVVELMDLFAAITMALFFIFFLNSIKAIVDRSKHFGLFTFITALLAGINFWLLYYFIAA